MVPLTREPKFHSVDITSITQNGLSVILQFTVPFTKLIPLVWIKVKLPILRIFDENEVEFLTLHFDDEFYFNGKSDLMVDLDVRIVVKDTCALRKYLSIATIGSQNDMNRITVILKFPISISFLGLFSIEIPDCFKVINLGRMNQQKKEFMRFKYLQERDKLLRRKENKQNLLNLSFIDQDEPQKPMFQLENSKRLIPDLPNVILNLSKQFQDLIPEVDTRPFISPGVLGIDAGFDLVFSKTPGLNFKFGKISFEAMFNQNCIGKCNFDILEISKFSTCACIKLHIVPISIADPLVGPLKTFKSMLNGVISGTLNGILYGEWGKESIVIGIKNIQIENENGIQVDWIKKLLAGFEFEYEIDALSTVGNGVIDKGKDFKESINNLTRGIIQEAECQLM